MDAQAQPAFDALIQHLDATAAETRRHIDGVAEGLRADIRLFAERWVERIDRLEIFIRGEIARSHDALAALIRLTYTDLDRRVTALEQRSRNSD